MQFRIILIYDYTYYRTISMICSWNGNEDSAYPLNTFKVCHVLSSQCFCGNSIYQWTPSVQRITKSGRMIVAIGKGNRCFPIDKWFCALNLESKTFSIYISSSLETNRSDHNHNCTDSNLILLSHNSNASRPSCLILDSFCMSERIVI